MKNLGIAELRHISKAAARIAQDEDVVIFGSNAIVFYAYDNSSFTLSRDVDLTFLDDNDESKTNAVDGAIGENSTFHETFLYYAHGNAIDSRRIAPGWQERARLLFDSDGNEVAFILSVPDLATCKLAAGRAKDLDFVATILRQELCSVGDIEKLINLLPEKKDFAMSNLLICLSRQEQDNSPSI